MNDIIVSCGDIIDGYKSRLLRTQTLDDSPEEKMDSNSATASLAGETHESTICQHLIKFINFWGSGFLLSVTSSGAF